MRTAGEQCASGSSQAQDRKMGIVARLNVCYLCPVHFSSAAQRPLLTPALQGSCPGIAPHSLPFTHHATMNTFMRLSCAQGEPGAAVQQQRGGRPGPRP